ncbi:hypothetical protein M378DRAFT_156357 [Amanita muscaria Koide BX008]|uniref:Uncharacterized protein n=1 Tax=Amanita muscaria (strain Koide BX008) TaxID=946122 RepID=A0A0C2XMA7_AMAMK|nr:hypothetical protein M378DRAFT_156357 [Amanita muscaria Koide BX008]
MTMTLDEMTRMGRDSLCRKNASHCRTRSHLIKLGHGHPMNISDDFVTIQVGKQTSTGRGERRQGGDRVGEKAL